MPSISRTAVEREFRRIKGGRPLTKIEQSAIDDVIREEEARDLRTPARMALDRAMGIDADRPQKVRMVGRRQIFPTLPNPRRR